MFKERKNNVEDGLKERGKIAKKQTFFLVIG